jgi:hypothetical protein
MGETTGRLEVEAHHVHDADALRANPEATALLNELANVLALAAGQDARECPSRQARAWHAGREVRAPRDRALTAEEG